MNELLVIFVLYKKKISDLLLIKEFNGDGPHIDVFIYDNSPDKQEIPNLENINFYYTHDQHNSGVSKGYNAGIKKAQELNKKCVVLLDHDSNILLTHLSEYISFYHRYHDDYLYAPVMFKGNKVYSPAHVNNFVGKVICLDEFNYDEVYDIGNKSLINNGLMIPLKLIEKVGFFNENIKLDFSDFYFIEKYKHLSTKVILIDLYIQHDLSGDEGKSYLRELERYKYYCNGSKELNRSLNKMNLIPALRRLLRLMIKYKTLKPIPIYLNYFIRNKKV